jgi:hypothetical protein
MRRFRRINRFGIAALALNQIAVFLNSRRSTQAFGAGNHRIREFEFRRAGPSFARDANSKTARRRRTTPQGK